jgi:hypothetical protein
MFAGEVPTDLVTVLAEEDEDVAKTDTRKKIPMLGLLFLVDLSILEEAWRTEI